MVLFVDLFLLIKVAAFALTLLVVITLVLLLLLLWASYLLEALLFWTCVVLGVMDLAEWGWDVEEGGTFILLS